MTGRKVSYFEAYRAKEKEEKKTADLKNKKIIVLFARVHPSEAAASHVLKGFIEALLDSSQDNFKGAFLRDNFMFIIIPMMNPDGVSFGNSRCSLSGQDLNKTWNAPDRFVHPESYYALKLLTTLSKENQIIFFSDFHESKVKKNCFIYGSDFDGKPDNRWFPRLMEERCDHFSLDSCK